MAWISGLADKAENILNKIDQNAATALQVTAANGGSADANNTIDVMRRSLSSSTQSLKATLSPVKLRASNGSRAGSVKSESAVGMSDSLESKEKLEWSIYSEMSNSSRRSSVHSKPDSVAIDVYESGLIESDGNKDTALASNTKLTTAIADASPVPSQELAAFKIALNEITNERDDLRTRLSAANRNADNATTWQRIQELEMLVQRLMEERDQAQQELSVAQTTSSAYVHSISELESNLAKLQQEYLELAQKLQMQKKETEQQRTELLEYRTKAQLALQMKDNLIAELKSKGATGNATSTGESELRVLQIEFDALKQEHQHALEESAHLREQLEELRRDWNVLNKQHAEQLSASRASEEALRKELRLERERLLVNESEQRVQTQELAKLRQQLSNQMAAAATRLEEKEQQLQQLRAERMRRTTTAEGENVIDDYDTRIKALTQTLVDKQNAVERIAAERNALRIQLEKAQDQLQQAAYNYSLNSTVQRNALLSNSTDDVKAQFPLLMRENPFDNRVARRVKRAYSSLDSVGIRLGAFLRRYPLMRVGVLMYVALLHLWVMFVLLSSTPN